MKPSIHATTKFLIVALSFAAGLAVGIGVKTTALGRWAKLRAQGSQLKADPHLLVAVPDVLQDTDYSCGASALQAVLASMYEKAP